MTTYYLLHRNDFKMDDAPVGACILYALSCNLSDSALVNQHDLLVQSKNGSTADDPEDEVSADDDDEDERRERRRRKSEAEGLGPSPGTQPRPGSAGRTARAPYRPGAQADAALAGRVTKLGSTSTWTAEGCNATRCSTSCCRRSSNWLPPAPMSGPSWKP